MEMRRQIFADLSINLCKVATSGPLIFAPILLNSQIQKLSIQMCSFWPCFSVFVVFIVVQCYLLVAAGFEIKNLTASCVIIELFMR